MSASVAKQGRCGEGPLRENHAVGLEVAVLPSGHPICEAGETVIGTLGD